MLPLSVVVTVVDGAAALERCLRALAAEARDVPCEILVPWDESVAEVAALAPRYPTVEFLPLGEVGTRRASESAAARHERIDRRRAAGLAAARGEVVAMIEDRGAPCAGWAQGVVAEHARLPHAVIGGAVEIDASAAIDWAVFLADFGRYWPPFAPGPRDYVTDVNVAYKREALVATRERWRERYHETTVHWALQRHGETLYLSNCFVVEQRRQPAPLAAVLGERVASGRLFAATRARETSRAGRLTLGLLSPALPALLMARHLAHRRRRRGGRRPPWGTAARLFLVATAWSFGEALGYATREG